MVQNENLGSEQSEETTNQGQVFVLKPDTDRPPAEPERRAGEPTRPEDVASGRASLPLPIPNQPALQLAVVFGQGASMAPGGNGLGWLFSGGLAARIP